MFHRWPVEHGVLAVLGDTMRGRQARAMQHLIDRSGIANRQTPTPYSGPQMGVGSGA
jgi:hypothetical protein